MRIGTFWCMIVAMCELSWIEWEGRDDRNEVGVEAGSWKHFVEGIERGGASAVCTSNIFHFTEASLKSAKVFMAKAGIMVRL